MMERTTAVHNFTTILCGNSIHSGFTTENNLCGLTASLPISHQMTKVLRKPFFAGMLLLFIVKRLADCTEPLVSYNITTRMCGSACCEVMYSGYVEQNQ